MSYEAKTLIAPVSASIMCRRVAMAATTFFALFDIAAANARTLYVNAGDTTPVAAAIRSGDLATARRLEQGTTDPGVRSIITAVIARMQGRYDDSVKVAKPCYEQASTTGQTNIALVCGRVWASNYFLQGDLNRWSSVLAEVWNNLKPALAKALNTTDISMYELDFASQVPSLHYTSTTIHASSHGVIPVRLADHKDSEYLGDSLNANASIAGKSVSMLVDTGAAFSVLTDADAARLQIKPTDVNVRVRTTPEAQSSQSESSMKLAVVPQISFGDTKILNAVVLVGGASQSVMGLNIIAKLPSPMVISTRGISFGETPMTCDRPMITATDLSGTIGTAFGFAPDIDGRPAFAALDLGNNAYIEGYANAMKYVTSATAMPMVTTRVDAKVPASYYTGHVALSSGAPIAKTDAPLIVLGEGKPAFDWTIGSGVLRDFSIYLDFKGHAACLVRKGAPPAA